MAHETSIPLKMHVEITRRCNERCIHCCIPEYRDRRPFTLPEFDDLFGQLYDAGTFHLTITGGEATTRPLVFAGRELELNYSTSAVGSVRVEIQDLDGSPYPGHALEDCPEKFGDEIEGAMSWKGGADVGRLAGRPVRLRFALKDADLYAFRFRAPGGPSL